jgi:hypothetical protein
LTAEVPSAPSVPASRLNDFFKDRDEALALLNETPIPYDTPGSLASRQPRR